jgi:hypothetical protein
MNYNIEDITMVDTKCEKCGVEGKAPTFKQILENKESFLTKMLEKQGYADILCVGCATVAVEKKYGKEETTEE